MQENNIDIKKAEEENRFKQIMQDFKLDIKSKTLEEANKFRQQKKEEKKVKCKEKRLKTLFKSNALIGTIQQD